MKAITFFINILLYFIFCSISHASGIDVSITLTSATGGGASHLNSITKITDEGEQKFQSGEKSYTIKKLYNLQKNADGTVTLEISLIRKENSEDKKPFHKKITISKNEITIINPYEGITIGIQSKGF